ncbi:MAG TPA: hypothetical protein VN734_00755 [Acidobacteriaceae bacterium]|nr:hypothetical protein [Acidobacteriaceae bacterium]
MKKLIALLVILLVVFVVVERKRVYVRDPLASVTRAGNKVSGEQVYINFYNDVLLENDNPPMLVMIVEKGQPVGVPTKLRCIHWLACLTDADAASALPLNASVQSMSGKTVRFRDENAQEWDVTLR